MPDMTEEQRKELEEKLKKMSPEELKEFQKQQCIFCQIIAGKVPSKKVYEDAQCIAVLDIAPASKGHLLIMPKEHYAIMPQIPDKEIGHIFFIYTFYSNSYYFPSFIFIKISLIIKKCSNPIFLHFF